MLHYSWTRANTNQNTLGLKIFRCVTPEIFAKKYFVGIYLYSEAKNQQGN